MKSIWNTITHTTARSVVLGVAAMAALMLFFVVLPQLPETIEGPVSTKAAVADAWGSDTYADFFDRWRTTCAVSGDVSAGSFAAAVGDEATAATYTEAELEAIITNCGSSEPVPQAPTCDSFSATPNTLAAGGGTTVLAWSTSDADTVVINHGIGEVSPNGQKQVVVDETQTFTLTASSAGGEVSCHASVTVAEPVSAPTCVLSADPETLPDGGGSTQLSWSTTGADTVTIDRGIGEVAPAGQHGLSVDMTQTFTLTATGAGGTVTCTDTVTVAPPPSSQLSCTLVAAAATIHAGDSTTLTWTTTGADTVTIDQGLGTVAHQGSQSVAPMTSKTFTLTAQNTHGSVSCSQVITVTEPPHQRQPVCDAFTASPTKFTNGTGGSVMLTWHTSFAENVTIDQGVGSVARDGEHTVFVGTTKTFTLTATNGWGQTDTCTVEVVVEEAPVPAPTCEFTAAPHTLPSSGGSTTLSWNTTNADTVSIDQGIGAVSGAGQKEVNSTATKTFTLTATGAGGTVTCTDTVTVAPPPSSQLSCTLVATPTTLAHGGGDTTLTWTTTNADSVTLDNGIGTVSLNGSRTISVFDTKTFTLTATDANGTVTCAQKVTVAPPPTSHPEPRCDALTASPAKFTNGVGGDVTLSWNTSNADAVSLDQGIGTVGSDGSLVVSVGSSKTFTLTATDDRGRSDTCTTEVVVEDVPAPQLSCDIFTVDASVVNRGETVTLRWETTGATAVSINQGIGNVAVDGSRTTSVNADQTFILTAKAGDREVVCTTGVSVRTGGGGGGGSNIPRCDLDISDRRIDEGESITLSWDNSRTSDIILKDNHGNVLIDTDAGDEYDEDEDDIKVKPTRDTKYTLIAISGSRERECTESVRVDEDDDDDDVVVISRTDRQPLASTIILSDVPYTGFEAGPFLTTVFYVLLALWGMAVAYVLVIKEGSVFGISLFGGGTTTTEPQLEFTPQTPPNTDVMPKDFTAVPNVHRTTEHTSSAAPVATSTLSNTAPAPSNLPTGLYKPVVGYAALAEHDQGEQQSPVQSLDGDEDGVVDPATAIENHAHSKHLLLSSDAIRFILEHTPQMQERLELVETLAGQAKAAYPSEDGWVVVNKERIARLMQTQVVFNDTTPQRAVSRDAAHGTSSLAEAIVTGNILSAQKLLDAHPVRALSEAAQDLDAIYRMRKGEQVVVSDLLVDATRDVTDVQLERAIAALVTIDGAYTDEAAAVRVAVMKAVQAFV